MKRFKELKGLKNLLHDVIDKGSTAIQEVHQELADRPFNVLERLEPIKGPVQVVRSVHDSVLRVSYDSVRSVNRVVAGAADKLMEVTNPSGDGAQGTLDQESSGASDPRSGRPGDAQAMEQRADMNGVDSERGSAASGKR